MLSYYLLPIAYDLLPVDQSEFIWACVQGVIDALKSPQSMVDAAFDAAARCRENVV